ncbi:MAG: alpha/beta fold hydrolase [Dysosmobacter sp.]
MTILSLSYPTDTAIIFYPGAKVEAAAYLPLLNQLRQTGLTCILVEMPFHLAIFDVNAAEDVMAQFPDIQHWYIAGHSMGGAMASQFASEYPDEVDGLLLLGAYLYGDYPPADTLTVYGSLNQSVEDKIDYTENVVEIEGGNHAQFGNYGPQKGDMPATISAEEQQAQTVEAISDFIAQRQK